MLHQAVSHPRKRVLKQKPKRKEVESMEKLKIPTVQEIMGRKLPEKKFKASPISATIWANETEKDGKKIVFKTVVLDRTYRDRDGSWKQTSSLRVADIPKAALVLNKAYEYLALNDIESIDEDVL